MSRMWANDDYDYFEDAVNNAVGTSGGGSRKRGRGHEDTSSDESADSDWEDKQSRYAKSRLAIVKYHDIYLPWMAGMNLQPSPKVIITFSIVPSCL